jgi:hypothetical protein
MSSTTYSEFEDWLPRPAAFGLALGLWITGFAVAGAAAWRMDGAAPEPTAPTATTRGGVDSTTSGTVIVIPEDVVVGRRRPAAGVTMKQKP